MSIILSHFSPYTQVLKKIESAMKWSTRSKISSQIPGRLPELPVNVMLVKLFCIVNLSLWKLLIVTEIDLLPTKLTLYVHKILLKLRQSNQQPLTILQRSTKLILHHAVTCVMVLDMTQNNVLQDNNTVENVGRVLREEVHDPYMCSTFHSTSDDHAVPED